MNITRLEGPKKHAGDGHNLSEWVMFEQMERDVFGIEAGYQLLVFFTAAL